MAPYNFQSQLARTSVLPAFCAKLGPCLYNSVITGQQFISLVYDTCYFCELNPWSEHGIVGFQRLSENSISLDFAQWAVRVGSGAHHMEYSSIMIWSRWTTIFGGRYLGFRLEDHLKNGGRDHIRRREGRVDFGSILQTWLNEMSWWRYLLLPLILL